MCNCFNQENSIGNVKKRPSFYFKNISTISRCQVWILTMFSCLSFPRLQFRLESNWLDVLRGIEMEFWHFLEEGVVVMIVDADCNPVVEVLLI